MPYKRPLGYRQAFGIKNKIAKTQGNQFLYIFLSTFLVNVPQLRNTPGPCSPTLLPEQPSASGPGANGYSDPIWRGMLALKSGSHT
jgi:hypothetical protein